MCIDYVFAYTIAGSRHARSYSSRCLKDLCTHFARCEQIVLRVSVYIGRQLKQAQNKYAIMPSRTIGCFHACHTMPNIIFHLIFDARDLQTHFN